MYDSSNKQGTASYLDVMQYVLISTEAHILLLQLSLFLGRNVMRGIFQNTISVLWHRRYDEHDMFLPVKRLIVANLKNVFKCHSQQGIGIQKELVC